MLACSAGAGGIINKAFLAAEKQHAFSWLQPISAEGCRLLLLQAGADLLQHPRFSRELARFQLGVDQFPINANLETPTARSNQLEFAHLLLVVAQQLARQTDGFPLIVSPCALPP